MSRSAASGAPTVRAWVESPLQMVSALEAAASGVLGPHVEVVHREGLTALDELAARLDQVVLPAGVTLTSAGSDRLWRTGRLGAVGDAFSGAVQSRELLPRRRPLVVLDDGLATMHLLDLLTTPDSGPLARARAHLGPVRRTLARAARVRLLDLARARRLVVFTGLPVPDETRSAFEAIGGRIETHEFAWCGSLREPELHGASDVVVGSAMATDGLISTDAYADWVHGIAAASRHELVYIPHRREDPRITARVADRDSIRVERGPWPVEVSLRFLPEGAVVHCLPSTPLLTLREPLRKAGVRLAGTAVPDDWWTPVATPRFRAGLPVVTESAS